MEEYGKGYPVPFEIELAEWLGRLNVIVSDKIGRFTDDELTDELKGQLKGGETLDKNERVKRLRGFLEILLWEGWTFPRGAQSPSVPEFYYGIIGLTKRFAPIFGYVDVTEEGDLNDDSIDIMKRMYGSLLDKLFILDYKNGIYSEYACGKERELKQVYEGQVLDRISIDRIIEEICNYIVVE